MHQRRKTIVWPVVRLMAMGSIPSCLVTLMVLKRLGAQGVDYQHVITLTLGIALILTSMVLVFKSQLMAMGQHENFALVRVAHRRYLRPLTIGAGALVGVLVTLSSVGAGALGTAILFFLYPRFRTVTIVGTDLAHAVPLTAIAGLGHMHLGSVDFVLLGCLLVGSLPGIYIGAHLGNRLPDRIVRAALASMLFMIGVRFAI